MSKAWFVVNDHTDSAVISAMVKNVANLDGRFVLVNSTLDPGSFQQMEKLLPWHISAKTSKPTSRFPLWWLIWIYGLGKVWMEVAIDLRCEHVMYLRCWIKRVNWYMESRISQRPRQGRIISFISNINEASSNEERDFYTAVNIRSYPCDVGAKVWVLIFMLFLIVDGCIRLEYSPSAVRQYWTIVYV